jgi:MoxR-like ATPase
VASPLTAAAVRGGIAFFDEAAKAPARAMAPLASLLDNRRTLTSVLAGFTIRAHPSFRFCAATNDTDAATGGLPAFLDERLRPSFRVDYPSAEQSVVIALGRTEIIDEALMDEFRRWALRQTNLSPRRAIALLGFAARLANYPQNGTRPSAASVIAQAVQAVTSNEHLQ